MANRENKTSTAGGFFTGAIVGALIGTVLGVLVAPKKGEESREDLKKIAKDVAKKVETESKKASKLTKAKYHKLVDKVTTEYQERKDLSIDFADELAEDLKERWSDIREIVKK